MRQELLIARLKYPKLEEDDKAKLRNSLINKILIEFEKFVEFMIELINSNESTKEIEEKLRVQIIKLFFASKVKILSDLVDDLVTELIKIIETKPRSKTDYDNISEKPKKKHQKNIINNIFLDEAGHTDLRACQSYILNQSETAREKIINRFLERKINIFHVRYPAIRHDKKFAKEIHDMLRETITYRYSNEIVLRMTKYNLCALALLGLEDLELGEQLRPTMAYQAILQTHQDFYRHIVPEEEDAYIRFLAVMSEIEPYATDLENKFFKAPIPIKSALVTTMLVSGGLWLSGVIGGFPLLLMNASFLTLGSYYDVMHNKRTFRKEVLSKSDAVKLSDAFFQILKFKKIPAKESPHGVIYTNCDNHIPRTVIGHELANLLGERIESSHTYLTAQLGPEYKKEYKEISSATKVESSKKSNISQEVTTWLHGIIRSDMLQDIKKGNLPGGKGEGFFWIAWDSFRENYDQNFKEKLENDLKRDKSGLFRKLINLQVTRDIIFGIVQDNNFIPINNAYKEITFDSEIRCRERFGYLLIPADQENGKSLCLICFEIKHLISPGAVKKFTDTQKSIRIYLTAAMIQNYQQLTQNGKKEAEEPTFFRYGGRNS